ncbi:nuclear transport factor 2 family protein [Yinghuangia seranimata]|uniref:nuclear transport factor 2 family protein n=1 Tax=Yinghuangia seranimata TaxID=408067 RepID=UPI00248BB079|nr:nuclear transport factor 2 family protein [Yinghuangia seranimata]MDI2127858.1 nuclear transport factor 2 family protein [Yinghuangia seranimata]
MSDAQTLDVLNRFNAAFLRHEPALLDELVAEDCAVENTDGKRHEGRAASLALWKGIAGSRDAEFEPEEITASGDRGVIRWRLRWGPTEAESVRGVNLMRLRDGLIVEAMGYVKG